MWGRRLGKKHPFRKFSFKKIELGTEDIKNQRREFSNENRGRQIRDPLGTNRLRPKSVMDNERLVCA